VLRTALKPRWLGLFAVLVVVVTSFTWLGLWQFNVAQDKSREELAAAAAARPVVPLQEALRPHAPFPDGGAGRRVTATGRYAADDQLLIAPRRLGGRDGAWVVTPLVLDSTGATLAVVRGFVAGEPGATAVPEPPAGTVTVVAALAPGESPAQAPATVSSGADVRGSIDLAELVNEWPGDLYNAFGFAVEERDGDPSGAPVPAAGLERVPPPVIGESGLSWRNAAYALQWWIFAAFAAYMWFRMVRDDHQLDLTREETHV
jgi:cytochrome oxidase assembly protein ShyY1